jgi:hypothetical protein
MDNRLEAHEEVIIKRQWIAVVAAFILFFVGSFLSTRLFGVTKYGALGVCIPMLYLGISSIKNRLSIIRFRGQKGYTRDKRAMTLGIIMLALASAYTILVFMP